MQKQVVNEADNMAAVKMADSENFVVTRLMS